MFEATFGKYLIQQEANGTRFNVYELIDLPRTPVLGGVYGYIESVKNRRVICSTDRFRDAKSIAIAMSAIASVREYA